LQTISFNKLQTKKELFMKRVFLKSLLIAALASAALQAMAIGRVADVNVIDRSTGRALPVHFHQGEYWVAGQPGAKYSIQIRNSRGPRVLAVASVDGLNVLSGETADFGQSGYVFGSAERYGIEGWRKSDSQIAAFVFTASPGDSYAERIGKPLDMGVIGVALFRERAPVAIHAPVQRHHHHESPASSAADMPNKSQESANSTPPPPAAAPRAPAAVAPMPQKEASSKMMPRAEERERESASASIAPQPAPKLGTAHGERERSVVTRTQFVRNSSQPDEIIRIRYDSHANLVALGVIASPQTYPAPNAFPGSPMGYVPDPPARY
jgi:hypothetical protein